MLGLAIGKERKEQRGRRDLIRKRSASAVVINAAAEYSFQGSASSKWAARVN